MPFHRPIAMLSVMAALSACVSSNSTPMDRSFTAKVGDVTVQHEAISVYLEDGSEQMLFRFFPVAARSIEERMALATASMQRRSDCRLVPTSSYELAKMSMIDGLGAREMALIAPVKC